MLTPAHPTVATEPFVHVYPYLTQVAAPKALMISTIQLVPFLIGLVKITASSSYGDGRSRACRPLRGAKCPSSIATQYRKVGSARPL
jgi:hypothetical protein